AELYVHKSLYHSTIRVEYHVAPNALRTAPEVASYPVRVIKFFVKETLDELLPLAAGLQLEHAGLPQPPPWKRSENYQPPEPGALRLHGFISKPEIQKLNRNSIYIFVNQRLIRDRLVQHAITEAYRNILPPTVFPVVLLFLEMPGAEVDVNVHPSKTEVRFRQQALVHDFVRDTVRAALLKAKPTPGFLQEITAQPRATPGLTPGVRDWPNAGEGARATAALTDFALRVPELPAVSRALDFAGAPIAVEGNAAVALASRAAVAQPGLSRNGGHCGGAIFAETESEGPASLENLRPLGQVRNSFIVAADGGGLWIIDQHVAPERVLFERVLRQRARGGVEPQAVLLPLVRDS